jgi:lysozyme
MNPPMQYSQNGMKLTESFESCQLHSYQDQGGVWTIAWGHTRGVGKGLTCCQIQASLWLAEDIGYAAAAVNQLVTVPLTQGEFDALVDFEFNTGALAKSTMLALLNQPRAGNPTKNYLDAAAEFEKWDHVAGKVVAGLLKRRQMEEQEFDSPS